MAISGVSSDCGHAVHGLDEDKDREIAAELLADRRNAPSM